MIRFIIPLSLKRPGSLAVFVVLISIAAAGMSKSQPTSRGFNVVPSDVRMSEGFDASQSIGVFLGIRTFDDPRFAEVPFAADDAVDLAYLFAVNLELIKPESVFLILSGEPQKEVSKNRLQELLNLGATQRQPTQANIYALLEDQPLKTGPNGLFVLTLATHGFSDQGADYLVAFDSRRRRIARTGIAVNEIFDDVSRSTCPRRIVLIDACRERLSAETRAGGADPDSKMGQVFVNAIAEAEGQVILAGSTLGGYSFDDHELRNGVFSAAVVDGLQGKATSNEEGFITASGLAEYVNDRVLQWVKEKRPQQESMLKGIESRVTGNAAKMPLAVDAMARERVKATEERKEHLLGVLQQEIDFQHITGSMVDEISETMSGPDQETVSELLVRLEKLESLGSSYSPDFASWWNNRGLKVSVIPEFKELQVGQSDVFTIESNKPFDESNLTWILEPENLAEMNVLSSESSRSSITLKALEEGTLFLRVLDGEKVQRAQSTITIDVVLLRKPSLRYPILSLAAAGALGAYTVILKNDANEKLDEWNQCRAATQLPCEDLGDEYDSKYRQFQIVGVVAAASALVGGFLTYKYFKAKKNYEHNMNQVSATKNFSFDVNGSQCSLIYNF
jgi:hypothetical protein